VPPKGAFGKGFNGDLASRVGFLVLAGALMAAAFRQWFKPVQIES
jgi:hypothetical protein